MQETSSPPLKASEHLTVFLTILHNTESEFGIFKDSMPSNKTNGFTESILYIPPRSKVNVLANANKIDIKTIMERRTVKDVKLWKMESL